MGFGDIIAREIRFIEAAVAEFSFFCAHPALANVVDAICDIDLPDVDFGQAASILVLPTVSPVLCFHFRGSKSRSGHHLQTVTGVQTRAVTLRPGGPVGAVLVHLKPEAASHLLKGQMYEFTDAYIAIDDVLNANDIVLLEEMLEEADGAAARVAHVQALLLRHLNAEPPDPVARQAAEWLRTNPTLSVHQVASRLELSERQLLRRFEASVGTGPKQFAKVARLGKAIAIARRGADWTQVAGDCGFVDQSHMINAFNAMAGAPPGALFGMTGGAGSRRFNASLAMSDFCNTFFL